jgi:hypothetical protein
MSRGFSFYILYAHSVFLASITKMQTGKFLAAALGGAGKIFLCRKFSIFVIFSRFFYYSNSASEISLNF